MSDVNTEGVEERRQRVESLRQQELVTRQQASVRLQGSDDAVTAKSLAEEEARLLAQIEANESQGLAPEGGWPKPEDTSGGQYVVPMGTLDEVPEEATPIYVPGPADAEGPEGSPVTTTTTTGTVSQPSVVVSTPPTTPSVSSSTTTVTGENEEK